MGLYPWARRLVGVVQILSAWSGYVPDGTQAAHDLVLEHFRRVEGHADVWRLFANAEVLRRVAEGLAEPWRATGITGVVGIESRGFLLGAATAISLGVGCVAIRKHDMSR